MSNKKSSDSRRKILKSIAAGSGAIVAGKSLPESWSRPVVDSVLLPAHAQTSPSPSPPPSGCTTTYTGSYEGNASATIDRCGGNTDDITPAIRIEISADCTVSVSYTGNRPMTGTGTISGDTFSVPISRTADCAAPAGQNAATGTVTGTVSGTQISGNASFGGDCDCNTAPVAPEFSSTGTYTADLV